MTPAGLQIVVAPEGGHFLMANVGQCPLAIDS
jgi:hypothetical protein